MVGRSVKGRNPSRIGDVDERGPRVSKHKNLNEKFELSPTNNAAKVSSMQDTYIKELAILDYQGKRNPVLWINAKKKLEIYITKNYGFECGHLF
jgi:hypothetical protein